MTKGRIFSGKFKATAALEALRGDKTAQAIAAKQRDVSTTLRQRLLDFGLGFLRVALVGVIHTADVICGGFGGLRMTRSGVVRNAASSVACRAS